MQSFMELNSMALSENDLNSLYTEAKKTSLIAVNELTQFLMKDLKVNVLDEKYKLTTIPAQMFAGLDVKNINIPEGVTDIGENAFTSCLALETVVIPSTVEAIAYNAFENCSNMVRVTIPKDVYINSLEWKLIETTDEDGNVEEVPDPDDRMTKFWRSRSRINLV